MNSPKAIERAKKPYDAHLPPTVCYSNTREQLKAAAVANGVSMGEIMRQAVEFFLEHNYRKLQSIKSENGNALHSDN